MQDMKSCLICQGSEDQVSLMRVPAQVNDGPNGDFLICSGCSELLGADKVLALVNAAALSGEWHPTQFLPHAGSEESFGSHHDATAEDEDEEAPRSVDVTLARGSFTDTAAFERFLGQSLAALLLGQYRKGKGQVTLFTSLTSEGEEGYRFRALLGD